ncbi:condensation domain-containing protein [Colwellia maritima]|uniref:condensation domain-containing protein n=1 Tax=Colwellia maritima TaxID=2912588 RepID=UPI00237A5E70|nr:condensation domain-containing protein [Colwellia maritima]
MKAGGIEFDFMPIPRCDNNDSNLLSYGQQRIWYQQQLAPASNYYNEPTLAINIENELSISILRQAIECIVERHEVLRTGFPSIAGQPITVVNPVEPIPFKVRDLSHLSESMQEDVIQDILQEEESRMFDLSQGTFLFTTLIRRSRQQYLLPVSTHHIVFDGRVAKGFLERVTDDLCQSYSERHCRYATTPDSIQRLYPMATCSSDG